ncbi:HEPN domain-containing protein [Leptothoe spongobia]|uniref:HEPN domain-containing protein n=1 Tax=Leptothoe spongobia TAU-MAC 1115 TaxID=1967444 RepID=A0A947DIY9_9CYAN|nr:HEPN domain-containing protein [Leptothoe spongobia]MBT9317941.1 HEPN domain-containing protein [Leptothoe spongobia TAU-MAC 1115]
MNRPDEIQVNLDRAESSLQAARLLIDTNFLDDAASRAYYAVFHSASALLLSENLSFNSHSGVLRAISLNFVKTGRLDKNYGKNLKWLAELRQIGDYGESRRVTSDEAQRAISVADSFLNQVRLILRQL